MNKTKKIVIIALAAIAILALLFFLLRKPNQQGNETQSSTEASGERQETKSTQKETEPGKTNPTDATTESGTEKSTEKQESSVAPVESSSEVEESSTAPVEREKVEEIPTIGQNLALKAGVSLKNYRVTNSKVYPLTMVNDDKREEADGQMLLTYAADGYILFDLGTERELTGTRMYNYTWPYQWCINEQWSVYTSADGKEWTKQTTDKIDCSLFTASVDYVKSVKQGMPDGSDFAAPVKARYVKLVIDKVFVGAGDNTKGPGETANGGMSEDVRMYEFEILGHQAS